MKRMTAHAREPPGLKAFPQQKHRLAIMTIAWLAKRQKKAPRPYPVARSESYEHHLLSAPESIDIWACQRVNRSYVTLFS